MFSQASKILDHLFVAIYEEPLCLLRNNVEFTSVNSPLRNIMLIIDFETELSMNGILDFLGNSTGLFIPETIDSLKTVGLIHQADILSKIFDTANDAGMTYSRIQEDRRNVIGSIASWRDAHGEKWKTAQDIIYELDENMKAEDIYGKLLSYAEFEMEVLNTSIFREGV